MYDSLDIKEIDQINITANSPNRLIDIITTMKNNNIEPKRMRLVYPKKSCESNIVLIEGVKNGNLGLKILPPLYIHDEKGNYLDEVKQMFQ